MKEPEVVLTVPQGIILCLARILPLPEQKVKPPKLIMSPPKEIMKEPTVVLRLPKIIIKCPPQILPKPEQKIKPPKKKIFCLQSI